MNPNAENLLIAEPPDKPTLERELGNHALVLPAHWTSVSYLVV